MYHSSMKSVPTKSKKKLSPEKEFGYVFCLVFLIVAFLPLWKEHPIRIWAFQISALFFIGAVFFPAVLKYPCLYWLKLGLLLHRFINPIILGIIYFGVVCPIGLMRRKAKSGSIKIKLDPGIKSYWIQRSPAGPEPKTMLQQF